MPPKDSASQDLRFAEDIGGLKSSVSRLDENVNTLTEKVSEISEGMTEVRCYLAEGKERHQAFTESIRKHDSQIKVLQAKTDGLTAVTPPNGSAPKEVESKEQWAARIVWKAIESFIVLAIGLGIIGFIGYLAGVL